MCLQLREEVYGELANVDQVAGEKVCVGGMSGRREEKGTGKAGVGE